MRALPRGRGLATGEALLRAQQNGGGGGGGGLGAGRALARHAHWVASPAAIAAMCLGTALLIALLVVLCLKCAEGRRDAERYERNLEERRRRHQQHRVALLEEGPAEHADAPEALDGDSSEGELPDEVLRGIAKREALRKLRSSGVLTGNTS